MPPNLRPVFALLGVVLSSVALGVLAWSVVPQPVYPLFMVSVAASEWSLWFGGIAFVGTLLGGYALRSGSPRAGGVALVCGMIAMILAAKPPIQAWRLAAQEGVSLSLQRYIVGLRRADVEEQRDVPYAVIDGTTLRLDIYRPRATGPADPAIVVVHGGSWAGGAKGEFAALSRTLARNGYVVFDVEYRLATATAPFPAQVADVKCAIGWVKRNAATYGVDARRVSMLGRSAGGQVALLAAYTPDDGRLPPSCAAADTSARAVISFYAPVDLERGYNHPLSPDIIDGPATLRGYLGTTPAQDVGTYRLASPVTHLSAHSPPTLVIHGASDRLVGVEHARIMRATLSRVGVPHRVVIVPWANHGFDYAPNGWGSQIVEPIILRFLREYGT